METKTSITPARGSASEATLIKRQLAPEATDDEIRVYLALCERLDLDPFARQIYLIGRWDRRARGIVHTPQVSIDGFRLVAQRTGEYAGQAGPEWCGEDGVWRDVWLSSEPPAAARVGVYRRGWAEPLRRVALWREFVQLDKSGNVTAMWSKLASVMLAKCAEMQALRAAFPQELSGVYGDAEMAQASSSAADPVEIVDATPEPDTIDRDAVMGLLADLAGAADQGELDAVAARIKAQPVSPEDRRALGRAYTERRRAILGAAYEGLTVDQGAARMTELAAQGRAVDIRALAAVLAERYPGEAESIREAERTMLEAATKAPREEE